MHGYIYIGLYQMIISGHNSPIITNILQSWTEKGRIEVRQFLMKLCLSLFTDIQATVLMSTTTLRTSTTLNPIFSQK